MPGADGPGTFVCLPARWLRSFAVCSTAVASCGVDYRIGPRAAAELGIDPGVTYGIGSLIGASGI